MHHLFRLSGLLPALALCLSLPAAAQERPSTILVLDASGSMWGQIDGVNKIVIAREVVADLLADFPADQDLGLVAYGHNRRGDCADIETLIAPARGAAAEIAGIVNALNPRGMTPMTDAVIAAAEALRYTENAATVILVSDGIETCNPDPCAAARVLEETGVDFTAHVVGFDVAGEPEALAQMQCIAEGTGGQFLTADNAQELATALETVTAALPEPGPEPEPEPVPLPEAALDAPATAPAGSVLPVGWTGPGDDQDFVQIGLPGEDAYLSYAYTRQGNPLDLPLPAQPGSYELRYVWQDGSVLAAQMIELTEIEVTLTAPDSVALGTGIAVDWTGPDTDQDYIQIGLPGEDAYLNYAYTRYGSPATLLAPAEPGTYELRYVFRDGSVLASRMIAVSAAEVSLQAPASAAAGSQIDIAWTGPDAGQDYVQIGLPGEDAYLSYAYTGTGNPVTLQAPAEPGSYELRYVFTDGSVLASRMIEVTEAKVGVTAPAAAPAGSALPVQWAGPGNDADFLGIGRPGEGYGNYVYVNRGNPAPLVLPVEPGDYEIVYYLGAGEVAMAATPITVTPVTAAITVDGPAVAGQTVRILWEGPGYDNDFIGIGQPGAGYETYEYVGRGNPVSLRLPDAPDAYEVVYYLGQGETALARTTLTVTAK